MLCNQKKSAGPSDPLTIDLQIVTKVLDIFGLEYVTVTVRQCLKKDIQTTYWQSLKHIKQR